MLLLWHVNERWGRQMIRFKRGNRIIWTTLDGGRLKGTYVKKIVALDTPGLIVGHYVVLDAHPYTEEYVRAGSLELA